MENKTEDHPTSWTMVEPHNHPGTVLPDHGAGSYQILLAKGFWKGGKFCAVGADGREFAEADTVTLR